MLWSGHDLGCSMTENLLCRYEGII